jgi:4-carboxymuconolactone decarboxylase
VTTQGSRAAAPTDSAQHENTARDDSVPRDTRLGDNVHALDALTLCLVRLSAVICSADEIRVRDELQSVVDAALGAEAAECVEELILQSYLFAGLPRALNAMREWRRVSGRRAPAADDDAARADTGAWRERGEMTCAQVYGRFYERLRHNIADLHPALDEWMIVEGYGKVLGREGLDLRRRELCIIAACAVQQQDRQLHSHLHGALNVGATIDEVDATLHAIRDLLPDDEWDRVVRLWKRVRVH